jgi:hypothetical protein
MTEFGLGSFVEIRLNISYLFHPRGPGISV